MIPILRLGLPAGPVLVATVQSTVTDEQLEDLQERLAEAVTGARVAGVVIDISVLDVLDSFSTRVLHDIGKVARLAGAEAVIVGIQPGVAMALVQLGLGLDGVTVAADLDAGLEHLTVAKGSS